MIRRTTRKLTLEERISRLERALTSNRKSRRFESAAFDTFTEDEERRFMGVLNRRIKQGEILVKNVSVGPDTDTWFIVISDEDGRDETDFSIYKYTDGHIEAWRGDRSHNSTSYNSVEECAEDLEPYDASLWGDDFY